MVREQDNISKYCVKRFNLHPDWVWKKAEWMDDVTEILGHPGSSVMMVEGAVYPEVYKSGKRKGQTNYKKPSCPEQVFYVLRPDLDEFKRQEKLEP